MVGVKGVVWKGVTLLEWHRQRHRHQQHHQHQYHLNRAHRPRQYCHHHCYQCQIVSPSSAALSTSPRLTTADHHHHYYHHHHHHYCRHHHRHRPPLLSPHTFQLASTAPPLFLRVQVLILSPTRELAEQTARVTNAIGEFLRLEAHCCVGGKNLGVDMRKLSDGVHIVSGTPGRVYDMISRTVFRTKSVRTLILDEADTMLDKVGGRSTKESKARVRWGEVWRA